MHLKGAAADGPAGLGRLLSLAAGSALALLTALESTCRQGMTAIRAARPMTTALTRLMTFSSLD